MSLSISSNRCSKSMNKSESKYFNTAVKMDEAFLKLLSKKEFEYITVKEICKEAGVNRSTFYLHYETVGDLLVETSDYINDKFVGYFAHVSMDIGQIDTLPLEQLYLITPKYLMPWLSFIKENKRLFQTFLKRHETLKIIASYYEEIFKRVICPILTRFRVQEEDQEYMFLFYVEGIVGIVKKWIREGCVRTVDDVSAIIIECIKRYETEEIHS